MKLGQSTTRVLFALIRVQIRDGRATLHSVTKETLLSGSTVMYHLKLLRAAGLVEWEANCGGTLRAPLAAMVLL